MQIGHHHYTFFLLSLAMGGCHQAAELNGDLANTPNSTFSTQEEESLSAVTPAPIAKQQTVAPSAGEIAHSPATSTPHVTSITPEPVSAPSELVTAKGRRFVRKERISKFAGDRMDATNKMEAQSAPLFDPKNMTLEQLAEALRPVGFFEGYRYELDHADYETAARILSNNTEGLNHEPLNPTGASADESQVGADIGAEPTPVSPNIVGVNNAIAYRDNTTYPYRTYIVFDSEDRRATGFPSGGGGCTMSLIGASTAISMAHCFWSQNDGAWRKKGSWAAGVDSEDANPTPYGINYGCYFVTIPTAFANGDTTNFYDFAAIEFSGLPQSCGFQYPGNTVGALGSWIASDSMITSNTLYGRGYPSENSEGYTWNWPQLWGHVDISPLIGTSTWVIRHDADLTYGHSGAGMYQFFFDDGYRYVTAIHQGYNWCRPSGYTAVQNCARRYDTTVASFVSANTALLPWSRQHDKVLLSNDLVVEPRTNCL